MSQPTSRTAPSRPAAGSCPICGGRPDAALHPFCSKRCADVDLGRWFTESYRVPSGTGTEFDEVEGGDETG